MRLIILVIGIWLVVILTKDLIQLLKKKERVENMKKKVMELTDEQQILEEKLDYVISEEFVEKEAREKLNLARENEIVAVLPEEIELIDFSNQPEKKTDLSVWQQWLDLFF